MNIIDILKNEEFLMEVIISAIITGAVSLVTCIIIYNRNIDNLYYKLSKGHDSLSKENYSLSKDLNNLSSNVSSEHKDIKSILNNIDKYCDEERTIRNHVKQQNIDVSDINARINELANSILIKDKKINEQDIHIHKLQIELNKYKNQLQKYMIN